MTSYTNTWNESSPQGSDLANQLDTFIQAHKGGENERIKTEHYSFGSSSTIENVLAAGRHRPGIVACMFKGTAAQIAAILATRATPATISGQTAYGPGEGALYYNTDDLGIYRYDGTLNTTEQISSLGADAGTPTQISGVGSPSTLLAKLNQNIQPSTTRTTYIQISGSLSVSGSSSPDFLCRIYVNATSMTASASNPFPPIGSYPMGHFALEPTDLPPAIGSAHAIVPAGYYYWIYFKNVTSPSAVTSITSSEITTYFDNLYMTTIEI